MFAAVKPERPDRGSLFVSETIDVFEVCRLEEKQKIRLVDGVQTEVRLARVKKETRLQRLQSPMIG